MFDFLTIDILMRACRLLCVILGTAIVLRWSPSVGRVLRRDAIEGDGARAIWWLLAVAVLLFQAKWLYPGWSDLTRARVWLLAQVAMTGTLVIAIYHHGLTQTRFDLRRTILAHAAMLVLCVAFVSVAR